MREVKEQTTISPNLGTLRDDISEYPRAVRSIGETAGATITIIATSIFGPLALTPYVTYRTYRAARKFNQAQGEYVDPRKASNAVEAPYGWVSISGDNEIPIGNIERQRKKRLLRAVIPQAAAVATVAVVSLVGVNTAYDTAFNRGGDSASATAHPDTNTTAPEQPAEPEFSCPLVQPLSSVSAEDSAELPLEFRLSTAALQFTFKGVKKDGERLYTKKIDGWYGSDTAVAEETFEEIIAATEDGQQTLAEDPLAITPNGYFDTDTECKFVVGILSEETELDLTNLSKNEVLIEPFLK